MDALAIVAGIVKILGLVTQYFSNKQLIDAGVAEAVASQNTKVLDAISKSKALRDKLAADPALRDSVRKEHSRDE